MMIMRVGDGITQATLKSAALVLETGRFLCL